MKKKKLIWLAVVVMGILLAAAAAVYFLFQLQQPKTLKMGEEGCVLYSSLKGSVKAERVYIGEDGNAYIDFTTEHKAGENSSYLTIDNVEINGWMMHYADKTVAANEETNSISYIVARKAVLEYSGITSIESISFDLLFNDNDKLNYSGSYCLLLGDAENGAVQRTPVAGEQVVADTDDVAVVIERTDAEGVYSEDSRSILVYMNNKSEHALQVDVALCSVNNLSYGITARVMLNPGAQARLPIEIYTANLAEFGLTTADKLGYAFEVRDMETRDWLLNENVELFVTGLTEETLPEYTRLSEEGEKVIVDNEKLTFVIYSAWRSGETCYFKCFVDNKSEYSLNLATEQPTVNGKEARANTNWYTFGPYLKSYETMIFYTDAADADEALENISFKLSAYLAVPNGEADYTEIDVTDRDVVHEFNP